MRRWLALIAIASAVLTGCGKNTSTPGQGDIPVVANAATLKTKEYRNDKGELECPVMHGALKDSDKATLQHASYNGITYYFCCGGCPEQFKENPAKYAVKMPADPGKS